MLKWIITLWPVINAVANLVWRTTHMDENIKEMAKKIIEEVKAMPNIGEAVQAAKAAMAAEEGALKKALAGIRAVQPVVTEVIHVVERVGAEAKLAGDKKRDLAVAIINELVDIPMVPEAGEAYIIGFIVDMLVGAFNKKLGKSWGSK